MGDHLNGGGVSLDDALAAIRLTEYVVLPDGRTTICQVTMDNGFTVTGQATCARTTTFNATMGKGLAFDAARDRVIELLHFRRADALMGASANPSPHSP